MMSCAFCRSNKTLYYQLKNSLLVSQFLLKKPQNSFQDFSRRLINYRSLLFWKPSIEQLKIKDGVENHYQLVYKADSMNYVKIGYNVASWTALPCILSFLVSSSMRANVLSLGTPLEFFVASLLGFVLYSQIFHFANVYILRVYYSEESDKFIAILTNRFPYENRKITMSPGEPVPCVLQIKDSLALIFLMFKDDLYNIQSRKVIVTSGPFSHPFYYNKLLGYQ